MAVEGKAEEALVQVKAAAVAVVEEAKVLLASSVVEQMALVWLVAVEAEVKAAAVVMGEAAPSAHTLPALQSSSTSRHRSVKVSPTSQQSNRNMALRTVQAQGPPTPPSNGKRMD